MVDPGSNGCDEMVMSLSECELVMLECVYCKWRKGEKKKKKKKKGSALQRENLDLERPKITLTVVSKGNGIHL